jgi:hypothetical protein
MYEPLAAQPGSHEPMKSSVDVVDLLVPDGIQQFEITKADSEWIGTLHLPPGYAVVGGAARDVLSSAVNKQRLPIRDIDIVAFTELNPDTSFETLRSVSQRLMPDDAAFGHGVSVVPLATYFETRDFTVNEVTIIGDRILASPMAISDLSAGIVRPSTYRHDPENNVYLPDRLRIKALLMETVMTQELGYARIEGFDPSYADCDNSESELMAAPAFDIALGYQKALEYGELVAHSFLDKLLQQQIVTSEQMCHRDARFGEFADLLSGQLEYSGFQFRGRALDLIQNSLAFSLGQMLSATEGTAIDHGQELSERYGGRGHLYTDESKY